MYQNERELITSKNKPNQKLEEMKIYFILC